MGFVLVRYLLAMGNVGLIQNHVECEVKRGRYDKKSQYLCSECERRNRRKRLPVVENLELGRLSKDKKQI